MVKQAEDGLKANFTIIGRHYGVSKIVFENILF